MNNDNFNKLLKKLSEANSNYKLLLDKAEKEFERRYKNHPSDIDYDPWIDVYHIGAGFLGAEEIDKDMKTNNYKTHR